MTLSDRPAGKAVFAIPFALITVFFLCLSRPGQAAAEEAVAMVTDRQGQAALLGGQAREGCEILSYLFPGSRIRLGPEGRLTLVYFDSAREYDFSGPAVIEIAATEPLPISGRSAAARSLPLVESIGLTPGNVTSYVQAGLTLRTLGRRAGRGGARLRLIAPVDDRLLSPDPEFRWRPVPDATDYRYVLMDEDGKTLFDGTTGEPRFRLPKRIRLRPGGYYSWRVESRLRSGDVYSSTGRFSVLSDGEKAEIEAHRPKSDALFSEQLLFAILLERMGVFTEAERSWRALAKRRPAETGLRSKSSGSVR